MSGRGFQGVLSGDWQALPRSAQRVLERKLAGIVRESREYRKAPEERLEARLGLSKYNVDAPLQPDEYWKEEGLIHKVKIMLGQHIGAPAVPTVEKGAQVKCGQCIANPAQGLSVGIHASVDGRVQEVTERYIVIVCQ